jgi:hypothetical protein
VWFRASVPGVNRYHFVSLALLLCAPLVACGGTPAPAVPTPLGSTAASTTLAPALTGLPERRFTPPPGAVGSRAAHLVAKVEYETCHRKLSAPAAGTAQLAAAQALARACAATTKLIETGANFTGTLKDTEAGSTFALSVKAGQCVRFYASTGEKVQSATLVIRDSKGMQIYEDSGDVIPRAGEICADSADTWTLLYASGIGDGPFVLVPAVR